MPFAGTEFWHGYKDAREYITNIPSSFNLGITLNCYEISRISEQQKSQFLVAVIMLISLQVCALPPLIFSRHRRTYHVRYYPREGGSTYQVDSVYIPM